MERACIRDPRENPTMSPCYIRVIHWADEIESSNREEDVNSVGSRDGDIECLIKVLSSNHLSWLIT